MSEFIRDIPLEQGEFESAVSHLRVKLSDVTLTEKNSPFPFLASAALMIYRQVFEVRLACLGIFHTSSLSYC